ncbi:MAG: CidA/LrgA family protein, partial [Rhodospirillaceae bacterium]|nr:CidA/LrgA family protein [Rhodospirillaceae bacterium]
MTLGFITVLLAYQLVGEVISKGLELPLPGPVVGMGLLFVTLLIKGNLPEGLKKTSQG